MPVSTVNNQFRKQSVKTPHGVVSYSHAPDLLDKVRADTLDRIVQKTAQEIFESKKRVTFHLARENQDFFCYFDVKKMESGVVHIENIQLLTRDNISQVVGKDLTEQSFQATLQKLPQVVEKSAVPAEEISDNEIKLKSVTVHLTEELLKGMNGDRDESHQIARDLLTACLRKREKSFSKETNKESEEIHEYFKVETDNGQFKILYIFGYKYPNFDFGKPKVALVTAYYMSLSSLKHRHRRSDVDHNNWIETLPKVSI